jgi:5-methyltetrahydropteroyltriglutamate--homocysteine methyltransferase
MVRMWEDSRALPSERAVKPPFRADQVGSLLRPDALKAAREKYLGPQTPTNAIGPHHDPSLRVVEDQCIRDAIAMQERVGLRAVTDGEFRRRSWWLELILGWQGFAADRTGSGALKWRNESGVTQGFSDLKLTGRIRWQPSSVVEAFVFLRDNTRAVPKVTMPAPNCVHYYMGGRIPQAIYPDRDAFWADLVKAYKQEIKALVDAGARYIQLDDTSIAFICDPAHRDYVRSWGDDPEKLLLLYARKINEALSDVPDDVTVTLHQCRGNREGNWAAEGGYDPVADVLFNQVDVDGYFLEYDTERAGGFEPLRLVPKGKRVVLGLVSSKKPAVETERDLARRIDEAAKFAPLAQLALSPQCGFASSLKGNPLGPAEQEAKLRRIVEVADKVWGTA